MISPCISRTFRNQKEILGKLIAYFSHYNTNYIEKDASNNPPSVVCVFVAAEEILPELLPINFEGIITQPSPSNDKWAEINLHFILYLC
jgi:hypothetical protein